jgi:mevalonate kinase
MQIKASAPGSLMLLGEYAVLYGKHALVCAVDKRITVTLTPREDDQVHIHSDLHGHYVTDLNQLSIDKPFHFVLSALKEFQTRIKRGCDLDIQSNFSDRVGLGSSAAVTVATLAALVGWLNIRMSALDLVRQGRNIIRQVQGVGSGADIAASVFGGMVGYQAQPLVAEKYAFTHPLTALYAGYKTPTVEAIAKVQQYFAAHPTLFRQLAQSIGQCAQEGMLCVRKNEWKKLGEIMTIQQGLMESLGVSTPLLRDMVADLQKQEYIFGAKISGSGLGDCVIGLGETPAHYTYANLERIPVEMSLLGVQCEKI